MDVQVKVSKSGFCYDATGTVGARIKIKVTGGNLIVQAQVDPPNIDVDIPWYCWIAGAVIGALLGGVLFGVIGGIVGGVLVPLITYIAQEVIEGTINAVAQHITDALNSIAPTIEVPAVGFNLLFSDASIDDVFIACNVQPIDTAPVRASGTIDLRNGMAVDLDCGQTGPLDMPGADLALVGVRLDRLMEAVCGARLARTGLRSLDGLARSALSASAGRSDPIRSRRPGSARPAGRDFREPLRRVPSRLRRAHQRGPLGRGPGYRGHLGPDPPALHHVGEAHAVGDDHRRVLLPNVGVATFGTVAKPGTATFVPSPPSWLRPQRARRAGAAGTGTAEPDPCVSLRRAIRIMVPAGADGPADPVGQAVSRCHWRNTGSSQWQGPAVTRTSPVGRFDAVTSGLGAGVTAHWQVNGKALRGRDGNINLSTGVRARYHLAGTSLVLLGHRQSAGRDAAIGDRVRW